MSVTERSAVVRVPVKKIVGDAIKTADDVVAVEEPLAIRLAWPDGSDTGRELRDVAVTMRTPGHDEELALGFLFSEGLLTSIEQVARVARPETADAENIVLVELTERPAIDMSKLDRNFFMTSSCGVCGKASIDAIRTKAQFSLQGDALKVSADTLATLPDSLAAGQDAFTGTGSVHAAALFTANGMGSEVYEDVGRHNAVDKLIGANFRAGRLPLWNMGLFLSGRTSFELVQKARMAGCAMLAAVGAPSSLAIELAWESDMTLVGFVRDGRFNVYAGPSRIV
jgi:FdhD protein